MAAYLAIPGEFDASDQEFELLIHVEGSHLEGGWDGRKLEVQLG